MDIHNCVNFKDVKLWNGEMQKLYQVYVCDAEKKQVPHDPNGVEDMRRNIHHLENSIY